MAMRKPAIWGATLCCCALGASLAACVPEVEQETTESSQSGAVELAGGEKPAAGLEEIQEEMTDLCEEYAPTIETLEDGRQVQKVPDDAGGSAFWAFPTAYNLYYLNAENRGCESCHQDGLIDVLEKLPIRHWDLENGLDTNTDVTNCVICHDETTGETLVGPYQFGNLIHGIHSKESFKGDCMTCHAVTSDGTGMQLWEEAKYDAFNGMVDVANVQGEFTYDQDTIAGDTVEMTKYAGPDSEPLDKAYQEEPVDTSEYEDWSIAVTGMLDNPKEWTLAELIEQAPSKTTVSTMQCNISGTGSEWIVNAEVKGIPIEWILEQAGVQEGATTITAHDAEGWGTKGPTSYGSGTSIEDCLEAGGLLIYEINGRPLTRAEGFPCRMWWPGHAISNSGRWVSEIYISNDPYHLLDGEGLKGEPSTAGHWHPSKETDVGFANKPVTGIMGTPEGLIIAPGEKYEFEGYAYAMDEQVTSVEFSMDGGETWTSFDTTDSDKYRWVYWHFTWTAPEKETGGYVLQVRATTDNGRVSYEPDQVMVNVKQMS